MPLTKNERDLHKAILANNFDKVRQLIEHLETQENFVLAALIAEKPKIAKILLKKFKDKPSVLFRQSEFRNNAFHVAAQKGYKKIFAGLLAIARENESLTWMDGNDYNRTPLHVAIDYDQLAIARLLLTEINKHPNNQKDFINRTDNAGNSSLHLSCVIDLRKENHRDRLNFIVELSLAGANHYIRNHFNRIALGQSYYIIDLAKKLLKTSIFINKPMPEPIQTVLIGNNSKIKKAYFTGLGAHGSLKQLVSAFIVHKQILCQKI